jgi:ATP-dependent Clp protease ATP-binding subunit ClpC
MVESFFDKILKFIGLERFTMCIRKILFAARQEAKKLNADYIGSEHILLALIRGERGIAATVLINLRMNFADIEKEVLKLISSQPQSEKIDQTKEIVEYAIKESRSSNHNCVGTEDLLLALLQFKNGIAAKALSNLKLDFAKVRPEVQRILNDEK